MRRHSIAAFAQPAKSLLELDEGTGDEASLLQSLGKNMVVAVRVRPLSSKELESGQKSCITTVNGQTIAIKKFGDPSGYLKSQQTAINEYQFDAVFDEQATQMQIYQATAKPFIPNLIAGLNVTVFAYGATGAGKTHTMLGNTRADEFSSRCDGGIIPNTVADLFSQLDAKREQASHGESWTVMVTFVEIYNEQVYDLLEPTGKVLQLREDQDKGIVVVAGVTEQVANTAKSVMDLLTRGNLNRKTEATMANQVSSRSHAVLQLSLRHCRRNEAGRENAVESKLSLIDLAGSERASATNNRGARLIEGANINKSLLALANCINALASNVGAAKKGNVKYRDSRLTHLLKSSLEGGNCNLVMIANINPSDHTFEDSHNTLKYANRAKNIKVDPRAVSVAVESNWVQREARLREENTLLRQRVCELEGLVASLRHQIASSSSSSSSSSNVFSELELDGGGGVGAEAMGDAEEGGEVGDAASFAVESESVLEDAGTLSFGPGEAGSADEDDIGLYLERTSESREYAVQSSSPTSSSSSSSSGSRKRPRDAQAEAEAEAESCGLGLSDSFLAAGLEADASILVVTEIEDEAEVAEALEITASVSASVPVPVLVPEEAAALDAEAAPTNRKRRGSLLPQPKSRTAFREETPAPAPAPVPVPAVLAPVQPTSIVPSDRRLRRNTMCIQSSQTAGSAANDENANPNLLRAVNGANSKDATKKKPVGAQQTQSQNQNQQAPLGAVGRRKSLAAVSAMLDSSIFTHCSEMDDTPASASASASTSSAAAPANNSSSVVSGSNIVAGIIARITRSSANTGAVVGNMRKRRSLGGQDSETAAPTHQVFIDI